MLRLDHLAVTAPDLTQGVAWVEETLGVPMAPGGQHPAMGTHNRLLSLGPDLYLEVIAVDPAASAPSRPRWFALDAGPPTPRLGNWIVQCDALEPALSLAPDGAGAPMALSRGDLRWQMAVPETGMLPFDGCYPALISWEGTAHPAARLPEQGCRLEKLVVSHPRVDALRAALSDQLDAPQVTFVKGGPGLRAHLLTPNGPAVLS